MEAPPSRRQKACAVVLAIITVSYLLLAISGVIQQANRLTGAEFGVVVVAALAIGLVLRPDLLDRVEKVDVVGIRVELGEVKKGQVEVQKNQQQQQEVLDDVRLALRLLIAKSEQDHLMNLFKHTTSNYRVKGQLRDEIRRLRAMRLVEMCKDKTVAGIPSDAVFDLATYVALTEDGFKYVSRLASQPEAQAKDAMPTS